MGLTRDQILGIKNPHIRLALLAKLYPEQKTSFAESPCAQPVPALPEPPPLEIVAEKVVSSAPLNGSEPKKSTEKFFSVKGPPVGAPRMTQQDKWKQRPCVLRYREYRDRIRAAATEQLGVMPDQPIGLCVVAHFALPPSWAKKKRLAMIGAPHRARPDWDNVGKAVSDALLHEDSCLAAASVEKYWCWCESGQKTEITLLYPSS